MIFVYVVAVNLGKTGSYVDHIQGIVDASYSKDDVIYLVYPKTSQFTLNISRNIKEVPLGLGNNYLFNSFLFDYAFSLWLMFRRPNNLDKLVIRPSFLMLLSFLVSRFLKIYVQKEVNGVYNHELRLNRKYMYAAVSFCMERFTNILSNEILCVSKGIRDYYVSARNSAKFFVVSNGVSAKYLSYSRENREEFAKLKIVFVGTLAPWQGILEFLDFISGKRIFEEKVELYIVGDGRLFCEIKERLERTTLNYTMTGHMLPKSLPDFLGTMDLAVIPRDPSLDIKGSPLKLFVYAALGLPIISTQVDGVLTESELAEECFFFDYDSWNSLETVLQGIFKGTVDLSEVSSRMRKLIEDNYTWNHVYERQFYVNIGKNEPR
jgi:glycosyltransferase involved in cell wall biosynthesis